jgi:release factor glutamine methyltransferase
MTAGGATVAAAMKAATDALSRAGLDDAEREAAFLLARHLKIPPALVRLRRDDALSPVLASAFSADIERRSKREPAALITGTRGFFGREFRVTADTLVPRPETEHLVEAVLALATGPIRMIDLCTGSGCVAVSVAAENSAARVIATDVSESALAVARFNAEKHGVSGRIEFLRVDLYDGFDPAKRQDFDIIAANPPYVPTPVLPTLEPEIRFEPRLALDGGDDGLSVIRPLVAGAPAWLRPGGSLLVEIGFDQGAAVAGLFQEAGFQRVNVSKDYSGHDRIVSGVTSGSI